MFRMFKLFPPGLSLGEREKYININKFAGFSRDWVGGKILDCVFGVIACGEKNTHKQIPLKVP